jgi:hypothetical protein
MSPRRSSRISGRLAAVPKPAEPILPETKVGKQAAKKTGTTTTNNKITFTRKASVGITKSFHCACRLACAFKRHRYFEDRRVVLGQPDVGERPKVQCACKVHLNCAMVWARTNKTLPAELPCGCPLTRRGSDFWKLSMSRYSEDTEMKKEVKTEQVKKEQKIKMEEDIFDEGKTQQENKEQKIKMEEDIFD